MPPPANIDRRRRRHDHDVFISYRGSDVRNTFVDHLRAALRRKGVKVFTDDSSDDLPRGENLNEAIRLAIQRSKLYVVVLSRNYASSEWCLDELVNIMRCCHDVVVVDDEGGCSHTNNNKAIPIFYHLSPDGVTGDGGCYADVLESHKSRYTYKRVEGWFQALAWIPGNSGWVVDGGQSEAQLLKKISRDIGRKLRENLPAAVGRVHPPGVMENRSHAGGQSSESPGGPIRSSPSWGSSNGWFMFSLFILSLSLGFGLLVLYHFGREDCL